MPPGRPQRGGLGAELRGMEGAQAQRAWQVRSCTRSGSPTEAERAGLGVARRLALTPTSHPHILDTWGLLAPRAAATPRLELTVQPGSPMAAPQDCIRRAEVHGSWERGAQ